MFVPYNIKKLLTYRKLKICKRFKCNNAKFITLSISQKKRRAIGTWGGGAMQDYKQNLLPQNMVFFTSAVSFCFPRNVHIKLILTQSTFLLPSRFSDLPTALRSVYQAFAKEGQVSGQHQPPNILSVEATIIVKFHAF